MPLDGFGEIAEKLRRSTVHVNAGRRGNGSGIIVKPDGVIVTNAHVAAVGPIRVQLWDGTRSPADLLLRDVEHDLAILRISKSGLPAATLADSDQLRVGELVIAIGNPLGFTGALTTGVIYAIGRMPGLGFRKMGPGGHLSGSRQLGRTAGRCSRTGSGGEYNDRRGRRFGRAK